MKKLWFRCFIAAIRPVARSVIIVSHYFPIQLKKLSSALVTLNVVYPVEIITPKITIRLKELTPDMIPTTSAFY